MAASILLLTPVDDHHADWHGGLKAYQRAKLDWVDSWDQQHIPNIQFRHLEFESYDQPKSKLMGAHNQRNLIAVLEWFNILGRKSHEATEACLNFKGLEHRLELCYDNSDLKCYNDSKATSPSASIEALQAFDNISLFILQGNLKKIWITLHSSQKPKKRLTIYGLLAA